MIFSSNHSTRISCNFIDDWINFPVFYLLYTISLVLLSCKWCRLFDFLLLQSSLMLDINPLLYTWSANIFFHYWISFSLLISFAGQKLFSLMWSCFCFWFWCAIKKNYCQDAEEHSLCFPQVLWFQVLVLNL